MRRAISGERGPEDLAARPKRRIIELLVIAAAALGAGCGDGVSPELFDLTTSQRQASRGREIFLRATAFDPDGDLEGGLLKARLHALDGDLDLSGEAEVLGFEDGRQTGDVIVGLLLSGAAPLGDYEAELVAEDAAGNESAPAIQRVRYVR